jgi:hypothetical protein
MVRTLTMLKESRSKLGEEKRGVDCENLAKCMGVNLLCCLFIEVMEKTMYDNVYGLQRNYSKRL